MKKECIAMVLCKDGNYYLAGVLGYLEIDKIPEYEKQLQNGTFCGFVRKQYPHSQLIIRTVEPAQAWWNNS